MPLRLTSRRAARVLALTLTFLCASAGFPPPARPAPRPAATSAAAAAAAVADAHSVRVMTLATKDIVVDPTTQTIFASRPSTAGAGGNSITPIDPVAGTVGTPVFVGSEPGRLAITDNGQYIYVALEGANAVRRFDVAARTAGLQFHLGAVSFNGPNFARELAAVPGSPNSVAVARGTGFDATLAIYDNEVPRAGTVAAGFNGPGSLAFNTTNTSTLYHYSGSDLRRLTVSASGITSPQGNTSQLPGGGSIKFAGGLIYTSAGRVAVPETGALQGTFTANGINSTTPFAVDTAAGRAFFLTTDSFSSSPRTFTLRAFDLQTFVPTGSVEIGGVLGEPTSLVRWGANGLAFRTSGNQLFIIQTTLVPSSEPVPAATPTPSPTASPTPTPTPTPAAGELRQVALAAKDLVVDPTTQTVFASVPSSAGANGNSITPIDPVAGTAGTSVFVGSEPGRMAISDNGQYIYVSLDGANAVRRFDVAARTAGLQFSVGSDNFFGPLGVEDMEVSPGQPETVAISMLRRNVSPRHGGVAVFDNGVRRAKTTPDHTGSNVIEYSSSPTVLYGQNTETTEFGFRKMSVGSCGVVTVKVTSNVVNGFGADFRVDNGVAYSSGGRAIEPESGSVLGTFTLATDQFFFGPVLVRPDSKAGRVYFLVGEGAGTTLRVFDIKTFLPLGSLRLPGVTGTPGSLVRWGANGLAFRTSGNQVFLLQHSLVGGTATVTPAPAPAEPTLTINGVVTTFQNGSSPAGVTINVTGGITATTTTNASGNFTLDNIAPCAAAFVVTPSKPNYTFTPASITVSNPSATQAIQFSAFANQVGINFGVSSLPESGNRVQVTVSRTGDASKPATVDYETVNGTASDRSDFTAAFGTLRFGANEFSKTIFVLITDDVLVEGNETFQLKLKNPTGFELSPTASTFNVTIEDNDTAQATASPLQDARFFVRRHYQDFLNRDPADDPAGFDFWSNQITACNAETDAQRKADCFEARHVNVSGAFFLSIEFQETGFLAYRLEQAAFNTGSQLPFPQFLFDAQEIGRGVVVTPNNNNWQTLLETNKQNFVNSFVNRQSFKAAYPDSMTPQQYVAALNQNTGNSLTAAEVNDLANRLSNGLATRAGVLRSVAENAEFTRRQLNPAFVYMQYAGYMRRTPDAAGFNFWLGKLNEFNGNYIAAEMVKSFLVSGEYMQRFGPDNFNIRR